MSSFHQLGHHSDNLIKDECLHAFGGAILSPVNYSEDQTLSVIHTCHERGGEFEVIFDPQLYFPHSERGQLDTWDYFPDDFETADLGSDSWWRTLGEGIARTGDRLAVDGVCSPVVVPRTYDIDFFAHCVRAREQLVEALSSSDRPVLQTVLASLPFVAIPGRAEAVASVISGSDCEWVYLVVTDAGEPRREITDVEGLKGVMRLIRSLRENGIRVTVGFTSSDMLLWKAGGADDCATGKFFNLRRFTASRFEEASGGGGQLGYWFEEDLLGFLRESDILRVEREGLLGDASRRNPVSRRIQDQLANDPGTAWLAHSWRHYMWWFADAELRLRSGDFDPRTATRAAERNWEALEDANVLMEESRNDGRWIRPWRRALAEF